MTVPFLNHAPIDGFDVIDGLLTIDGKTVCSLANSFGQTPFYLYSQSIIRDRIKMLRAALPEALHLHYALKANPMAEIVALLNDLVDGMDVASAGEIDIALRAGVAASTISFAGPGKSDAELQHAITLGVTVNLESQGEMERLASLATAAGATHSVAIRVNPAFEIRQSGMKMGGGAKPFGVDEERVPDMLKRLKSLPLKFVGFHIFSGSQCLDEAVLIESHEKTIDLAIKLSESAQAPVQSINIGGGYGIPYFPGEKPLELDRLGACLEGCMVRLHKALPQTQMIMELGRFLVGPAGLYVSRVIDIKESRGQFFVITDGGLNHHLALSGNFGQVIRKNYPLAIAESAKAGSLENEAFDVVGRLCTPLDRMGDQVRLHKVEVGDLVAVFQSGAYGASASPSSFLGHPAVPEYFL